jgi:ATP synthase F1 delta subunit
VSVATTYAEALYEAAVDGDAVQVVTSEIAAFGEAIAASDELRLILENPDIDRGTKKTAVSALTEGAHPIVANFLQVLIDRGRIAEFPEIARAFEDRVARAEGRVEVEAVTAVPLPDDLRQKIVERVRSTTGATVELTESVDPDIVGGLVLRVGGTVVDGSVRHRIEELRQTLRAAPVDAAAATT